MKKHDFVARDFFIMAIKQKSSIELMNMYAEILAELNSRKVVRTYNNPVGDYAEWLVAEKLGLCWSIV